MSAFAETREVVSGLSTIIAHELRALSVECWTPQFNPDQSDSEIKFRKERVARLRDIRSGFENLMHGLSQEEA